jgi:hypothetical protein
MSSGHGRVFTVGVTSAGSSLTQPTRDPERPGRPTRSIRVGSVALVVGGVLSVAFQALWKVGHGPTVENEHGVVLGLTNDQWSYLSGVWMLLVAVGVVVVCRLHRGRAARAAAVLVVTGLAAGALSAWIWPLYSLGAVVRVVGIVCLAVVVVRGGVLPRWSGAVLLLPVVVFLPVLVSPDAMLAVWPTPLPFRVQTEDVVVALEAVGWVVLGVALRRLAAPAPSAGRPAREG